MKIAISLLSVVFVSCLTASGQTAKTRRVALPPDIAAAVGQDSDSLLESPSIKARIKTLLGNKYESFLESFETLNPVTKEGNYLFSSGCLIHACTHLESAVALDLVDETVHAAIFRQGEKIRYFNEGGRATPRVIRDWANHLREINVGTSDSRSKPGASRFEDSAPRRLRSKTSVHGFVVGESHDAYVIRARKGQILTGRLSWRPEGDNQASLTVGESSDFSGEPAKFGNGSHNDTKWIGKVPKTGDYYLYVMAHPSAHYTLKVSLK